MCRLLWGFFATLCVYVSAAVSEPYGDIDFLKTEPSKRKKAAKFDALLTASRGGKFEELDFVSSKSKKRRGQIGTASSTAAFQWDELAAKKPKALKVSELFTSAKKGKAVKVVKKDPTMKSWREKKDDAAEEYHFKMQMMVCPLGDHFKACMAAKNAGKNSNLQTKAKTAKKSRSMNASLKTKLKNKTRTVLKKGAAMMKKGNSSNVSRKTTLKKAQALAEEDDDDEAAEPSWGQLQGLKDMLGGLPPNPFFVSVDHRQKRL